MLAGLAPARPLRAQEPASIADLMAGQDLIYRGRYGAAAVYFTELAAAHPHDPAPPALLASALIWAGEARDDVDWLADSIEVLLDSTVGRAAAALEAAPSDSGRVAALFWLGSAHGYRARQAEARGGAWRASREARAMRQNLESAVALDSACVDCLLGLGMYDYGLARASAPVRFIARLTGLGSGNADRAFARLRRAADEGTLSRHESRWVYANALLQESGRNPALREEARRIVSALSDEFPENIVFRRFLAPPDGAP